MNTLSRLPENKKVYFASDFHLGTPSKESSLEREKRIVKWLDMAKQDAAAIFLLGDVFDFWFEYKKAIPKGFIRFQGKLAELADQGIEICLFTGNHDMWLFDYFPKEFNIPVHNDPIDIDINGVSLLIGHGDGLGPGDRNYKLLKKMFSNRFCQWAFSIIHPNIGIALANKWSQQSRITNSQGDEKHYGDKEHLLIYCRQQELLKHHDYYIFGHRHLAMDVEVAPNSRYINLGEWVNGSNYAVFEANKVTLKNFEA